MSGKTTEERARELCDKFLDGNRRFHQSVDKGIGFHCGRCGLILAALRAEREQAAGQDTEDE